MAKLSANRDRELKGGHTALHSSMAKLSGKVNDLELLIENTLHSSMAKLSDELVAIRPADIYLYIPVWLNYQDTQKYKAVGNSALHSSMAKLSGTSATLFTISHWSLHSSMAKLSA